jgi:hypothetical protein
VFFYETFSLSDCSECVRLAPVPTANRVGFNEMGTPADAVVPSEVGSRLRYQGARGENPCAGLQPESSLCRWAGGSSLLKNLDCLTHFRNSEDHERCIGAGLGSTVAVIDVDSGFAEPRCGAR